MVHVVPFQRSATSPPTAVPAVADVHDTPASRPVPGTDWIVQTVPSHCSASGTGETPRSLLVEYPTAMHALAYAQETPFRKEREIGPSREDGLEMPPAAVPAHRQRHRKVGVAA